MRTRKEILNDAFAGDSFARLSREDREEILILEVLLDIRDLLDSQSEIRVKREKEKCNRYNLDTKRIEKVIREATGKEFTS